MKHKTAELEGALLDAAVAKAEDIELSGQQREPNFLGGRTFVMCGEKAWSPSRDWASGGPILDRERIQTTPLDELSAWQARTKGGHHVRTGPTPLIAAMRAYVASKLGEEVEL